MGKKYLISWIVTILMGVSMLVSIFVPLVSNDKVSFSMFKIFEQYLEHSSVISTVGIVITIIFAVAVLLAILFALIKKPVVVIVFGVIALLDYALMIFDLSDRGVAGSGRYFDWTFVMYMIYVLGAIMVVGAIIMAVEKHKAKTVAANVDNE